MQISREKIEADTLALLQQLADDWEYTDEITSGTFLLADLGFESLDVVILSAETQNLYGQKLPFTQLFADIGQREERDITVGEWADFVHTHLQPTPQTEESFA